MAVEALNPLVAGMVEQAVEVELVPVLEKYHLPFDFVVPSTVAVAYASASAGADAAAAADAFVADNVASAFVAASVGHFASSADEMVKGA